MNIRPNLFWYATSELSQDAVLCWLLSWADKKHQALVPILHKVGAEFINTIYQKAKAVVPTTYASIEIRQQDGGLIFFAS